MTTYQMPTRSVSPARCTCDVPEHFDPIAHREGCDLLTFLSAQVDGSMLYPADLSTAALEGQWVPVDRDGIRWVPGIDG